LIQWPVIEQCSTQIRLNRFGDADLLTTLLAAAKVKQPRATANALLNGTSRGRASSTNVP